MSPTPESHVQEFISLFIRHQARLTRYVLVLLPDASAAEDIVQETALTLWENFDRFTPGTNFHAWSCRTAYFKVLEYRRGHASHRTILDPDVVESLVADISEKTGALDSHMTALRGCLRKLRPRDRELLERRYVLGEKGLHIAMELGRPANSVYQSLGRIRRALLTCVTSALACEHSEGGIA